MHQNQAHLVAHAINTESFAKQDIDLSTFYQNNMEQLKSLLVSIRKLSRTGSLAIASKSLNFRSFIICGVISNNTWILDSRAINHVTFDSSIN